MLVSYVLHTKILTVDGSCFFFFSAVQMDEDQFLWCENAEMLRQSALHGRRSVHVAEHRVEGMSEVVGLGAVVLLRHWQQEG